MSVPLGGCAKVTMILFIIMNLVFLALGITVIGVGAYVIAEGEDFEFFTGSNAASPGALLITVGCITFIVTAIGILGACCKSKILLGIYLIAIVIIVILEIAAAIAAFVLRNDIVDEIDERMRDAVSRYRFDNDTLVERDVNRAVDFVQDNFRCCGADSPRDWPMLNADFFCANGRRPPNDCSCDGNAGTRCDLNVVGTVNCTEGGTEVVLTYDFPSWRIGCINETRDDLDNLGYVVGGIGIAFGVVQILGFFMALGLCMCIRNSQKQEIV